MNSFDLIMFVVSFLGGETFSYFKFKAAGVSRLEVEYTVKDSSQNLCNHSLKQTL